MDQPADHAQTADEQTHLLGGFGRDYLIEVERGELPVEGSEHRRCAELPTLRECWAAARAGLAGSDDFFAGQADA